MRKPTVWLLGMLALTGTTSLSRSPAEEPKPFDDIAFVKMTASSSKFEIELGRLAKERTKSASVKKFANMMVEDHTKIAHDLHDAAKEGRYPIPVAMHSRLQAKLDKFKDYAGPNFDQEYLGQLVVEQEQDIALLTRATKESKDEQLKAFAVKNLPIVQRHLEMVKQLQGEKK